jgi:hypothetical protein
MRVPSVLYGDARARAALGKRKTALKALAEAIEL